MGLFGVVRQCFSLGRTLRANPKIQLQKIVHEILSVNSLHIFAFRGIFFFRKIILRYLIKSWSVLINDFAENTYMFTSFVFSWASGNSSEVLEAQGTREVKRGRIGRLGFKRFLIEPPCLWAFEVKDMPLNGGFFGARACWLNGVVRFFARERAEWQVMWVRDSL